ncbi:hydrolase [Pyxidicoccus trucidator]|uniref:hydrolase n=1 Tax=Pyxidicoccus trucidator TaxID=2709662 RepID=UPI0013D8FC1D|nr:hydrolase [Pyxidicoccus trucidator]
MPRTILVTGVDKPLGGLLAAYVLATSQDSLLCQAAEAPDASVAWLEQRIRSNWAASTFGSGTLLPETFAPRLRLLEDSPRKNERIDEVWSLGPTQALTLAPRHEPQTGGLARLRSLFRGHQVGVVNHVSTAYVAGSRQGLIREEPFDEGYSVNTPGEAAERAAEWELVTCAQEADVPWRIFRPAMLLGVPLPLAPSSPGALQGFLAALLRFKELIDSKSPAYLEQHPLRLALTPGAGPNVIRVEQALEWMFQVARASTRETGYFHLVTPEPSSLEPLGQHLRGATGLTLKWVRARAEQNPIDTLLQARIAAFDCYLTQPRRFDSTRACLGAVAGGPSLPDWERPDGDPLLEAFHQQWLASRQEARHEVTRALESLVRRTLSADDGAPIEYQVAGSGPVLICINAMGQNLSVWSWFIAHFLKSHRVIYWSPRGTYGPPSHCPTVGAQSAELELILKQEDVQQCRIVAWCSGAKIGIELLNRRPIASAMVLVTGAYAPMKGLEHLETTFQRTLRQMCQLVNQRKEQAALVKTAMVSMVTRDPPTTSGSLQASPVDVLALPSRELRAAVAEPFAQVQSICNYSFQVVDYASHDVSPMLKGVTTPTLLLGGELDQVVSSEVSRVVSERFPAAHFAELRGATHYCLYENAELLIELVERFFESPRTFRPESPELSRVQSAACPPQG